MPRATYGVSLSAAGVTIQETVSRDGNHPNGFEISLPAAKAATLTTRTDSDTGIATLASGHGIVDTELVDIFWTGGKRTDVDVTAVTSTTVSLNGGSGDDYPAESSAIAISKQHPIDDASINAEGIQIIGLELKYSDRNATSKGRVMFTDPADAELLSLDLTANTPRVFDIAGGDQNVFVDGESSESPINLARASHGNTSLAATLKIASLENV